MTKRTLLPTLAKIFAASVAAAAVLGGAAALGSTLFQGPPRDAAEFAARVEAGSTHWEDVTLPGSGKAEKQAPRRWPGRPRAEARYLRALDGVCAHQARALARLERPGTRKQTEAYLSGWLRIAGRHQQQLRALDPPRKLERAVDRYVEVWSDAEEIVEELLQAVRQRESFSVLLYMDDLDGLRLQAGGMSRKLNVTNCVAEGFPETL